MKRTLRWMIGGLWVTVIAACGDAVDDPAMAMSAGASGAVPPAGARGGMPFIGAGAGAQAGMVAATGGVGGATGAGTGASAAESDAGTFAPGGDAGTPDGGGGAVDAGEMLDAASDARTGGDAGDSGEADAAMLDAGGGTAGRGAEPPLSPVYRVPLRVHVGNSGLNGHELSDVLEEVNWIWWSQAAICFEMEIVDDDQTMSGGFDFWFHRSSIPCSPGANGVYCGDHDIHSLDAPRLGRTDDPEWAVQRPPARTAAHELGHGLTLDHFNGQPDSFDSLMSSGRMGFKLHDSEIQAARRRAAAKALADDGSEFCTPVAADSP